MADSNRPVPATGHWTRATYYVSRGRRPDVGLGSKSNHSLVRTRKPMIVAAVRSFEGIGDRTRRQAVQRRAYPTAGPQTVPVNRSVAKSHPVVVRPRAAAAARAKNTFRQIR